ncbi:hypothetical protein M2167_008459 [Streptomyces sp. SPB4]|nr:hypothetical protein [Streptomyces sp. SPB4]
MTPEEAAELSRKVAEVNRQSTSQSGKNGCDPMGGGQ